MSFARLVCKHGVPVELKIETHIDGDQFVLRASQPYCEACMKNSATAFMASLSSQLRRQLELIK